MHVGIPTQFRHWFIQSAVAITVLVKPSSGMKRFSLKATVLCSVFHQSAFSLKATVLCSVFHQSAFSLKATVLCSVFHQSAFSLKATILCSVFHQSAFSLKATVLCSVFHQSACCTPVLVNPSWSKKHLSYSHSSLLTCSLSVQETPLLQPLIFAYLLFHCTRFSCKHHGFTQYRVKVQ